MVLGNGLQKTWAAVLTNLGGIMLKPGYNSYLNDPKMIELVVLFLNQYQKSQLFSRSIIHNIQIMFAKCFSQFLPPNDYFFSFLIKISLMLIKIYASKIFVNYYAIPQNILKIQLNTFLFDEHAFVTLPNVLYFIHFH